MDIVDGAKRICFLMSARSKHPKWMSAVDHLTFNGRAALAKNQEVYLCSEYYTLRLTDRGWEVIDRDESDEAREALHSVLRESMEKLS